MQTAAACVQQQTAAACVLLMRQLFVPMFARAGQRLRGLVVKARACGGFVVLAGAAETVLRKHLKEPFHLTLLNLGSYLQRVCAP